MPQSVPKTLPGSLTLRCDLNWFVVQVRNVGSCFCYQSLMSKYGDHNFFCLYIWFCELAEKLNFSRWFWFCIFLIVHYFLVKPQKHSVCSERMVCSCSSILQSCTCTIPYFSLEGNELLGEVLGSMNPSSPPGKQQKWEFPLFSLSDLQPGHAHSLGGKSRA